MSAFYKQTFQSSRPGHGPWHAWATKYSQGCDCPGYAHNRKCWHVAKCREAIESDTVVDGVQYLHAATIRQDGSISYSRFDD